MIFAHPARADAHQKRVRRNVRERFPIPSWPGIGHFAKRGDGFHYVAAPMQLVL